MRYREPFTVFPRKLKSGRIVWYYQTYDETGKRTAALSTGQTTKSAARATCFKLMKQECLCPIQSGRMTFKQFSKDWWIWDKCEYLRYRRTRRNITRGYADSGLQITTKHILPYFSSMRLADIKPNDIERWLQYLTDHGLSSTTANNYKNFLSVMLTDAIRRGYIKEDVSKRISPLKSSTKEKGILDRNTVEVLFSEKMKIDLWPNIKSYYANLLSACTGMRLREILGLQYQDVNDNIVSVNKQYTQKYGITPTKTKTIRNIPIPSSLSSALLNMEHASEDDFIFASTNNPKIPIHGTSCSYALKGALKKMGMTADQIKEKNISFHSWRHYFNTIMRSNNITDSKLQKMTGHKSTQMTDHYTHYGSEDLKEIVDIQAKILLGSI